MANHPIDIMLDHCLQTHTTTLDMEECYDQASALWNKQMNISYKAVITNLDSNHQKQFKDHNSHGSNTVMLKSKRLLPFMIVTKQYVEL